MTTLAQQKRNIKRKIERRKIRIWSLQMEIQNEYWPEENYVMAEECACEITNAASEIADLEVELRELTD